MNHFEIGNVYEGILFIRVAWNKKNYKCFCLVIYLFRSFFHEPRIVYLSESTAI